MFKHMPLALIGLILLVGVTGCSKDDPVQIERFAAQLSEGGLAGQSVSLFEFALTGEQALVETSASGTARLVLGKSTIDYRIELNDISTSVQTVGLYVGDLGLNGTRVASFFVGNELGPINGVLTEGAFAAENLQGISYADLVDSVRSARAYVLVGTLAEPSGELRGQTGPRGEARFVLSGSTMTWAVEGHLISGVTSIGLHSGRAGINGPLRIALFEGEPTGDIDGNIDSGEFSGDDIDGLTMSELIAEMQNGNAYVLVATDDHPDGRMRGQLYLQF